MMLIALSDPSGTGKTTIAGKLARHLVAVYVQVDAIDVSMRSTGWPVDDEGYEVAYVVAEGNLAPRPNCRCRFDQPQADHESRLAGGS